MVALVRTGDVEARLSPRLAVTLQRFRDNFPGAVCVVASSECGKYALVLGLPAEPDVPWSGFSVMDEAVLGGPLPLH